MEQNLCVLIDFENVAAGTEKEGLGRFDIRAVFRRLKDKGRILVSRSYGDWGRFAKFKQGLLQAGVTMVELTSFRGADKNRADIAMVVDAMELAFTRDYIDTFVVLSGDSDFTPLVHRLREMNKTVIGIGTRRSTSRLLIDACDEFIFYESLSRGGPSSRDDRRGSRDSGRDNGRQYRRDDNNDNDDAPPSLSKDDAFLLLVETLEGIQKDEPGPALAGRVKQSMKRKEPAFDESEYGFAGFGRFLEAALKKGLVRLVEDEKAGGFRVDLGSDDGTSRSRRGDDEDEGDVDGDLPELPEAAQALREHLASKGVSPLTSLLRHTIVHEFVDHVTERTARKKRNTLMYTVGDVARRCRKSEPPVGPRQVRHVIQALFRDGRLIHLDGQPIRSHSAPFTIDKDAEELLIALRAFYIRTLIRDGKDVRDSKVVSQLLHGDDDHAAELEEVIAWVQHELTSDPDAAAAPASDAKPAKAETAKDETAKDEAPKTDGEDEAGDQAETAEAAKAEEEPAPKRRRRRRTRTKPSEDAEPTKAAAETKADDAKADDAKAEEAKPKKSRAKAKTKTKAKAKTEEPAAEEAEAEAEPAPKKKRTRRRKKVEEPAPEATEAPAEATAEAPAEAAATETD